MGIYLQGILVSLTEELKATLDKPFLTKLQVFDFFVKLSNQFHEYLQYYSEAQFRLRGLKIYDKEYILNDYLHFWERCLEIVNGSSILNNDIKRSLRRSLNHLYSTAHIWFNDKSAGRFPGMELSREVCKDLWTNLRFSDSRISYIPTPPSSFGLTDELLESYICPMSPSGRKPWFDRNELTSFPHQ